MSEPTPEVIERTARIVAEALDDLTFGGKHGQRVRFQVGHEGHQFPADYLSDHRTVARYLAHVNDFDKWPRSSDGTKKAARSVTTFMREAWLNPMPAIIALVGAVGEGE